MRTAKYVSLMVVSVGIGACAAGADDTSADAGGSGGGLALPGSGGAAFGSGGAGAGTGGAVSGVGGTVAGIGGTVAGTGGTVAGTGGTVAGTGGTVAGTGGTVAGTGGSSGTTASTFANNGYGQSGVWKGYLFTASELATVTPVCGGSNACFSNSGANVCATGTLNASYDAFSMIGFNVNQAEVPPNDPATWTTTGTGITVNVANPGNTTLRVKVRVGTTDYCKTITAGSQTVAWSSLKTECWLPTGGNMALPAGSAIKDVAVQVPGEEAGTTNYNFCVVTLAPAP